MIKFFRKIRQNLLSQGKRGKYLKYALGEIILVVLGILIALQINNWRESWIKNQKEQFYIVALQDEFRDNLLELKGDIEGRKKILKDIRAVKIANNLENIVVDTSKKDHVINEGRLLDAVRFFVPSSAIYKDLIATGNIDLLSSDSLRYWLMVYNQELKRNDRVEQIDFQFVHSFVIPFIIQNESYLQNESLAYEFKSICDRRISNNETILNYNQQLLTVIENVITHLRVNSDQYRLTEKERPPTGDME